MLGLPSPNHPIRSSIVIFLFLAVSAGTAVSAAERTPRKPSKPSAPAAAPAKPVSAPEQLRLEESLDAMGTTYSVVLYGTDRYKMMATVESIFEEVKRIDGMLSNYRPESELSEVNRKAAEGPVAVSKEFFDLLRYCLDVSQKSDGAFDLTVGPLMRVWGFYKGSGHLPHRAEIRGAMARVGYRNVVLDERNHTVRFTRSGLEFDPGGIGKGYAVDRMVEILRQTGAGPAMITAGGSSIYGLGAPPGEPRGWKLSLRDPRDSQKVIQEVFLKDMSMSTSGNYEKFFRAEGKVYSHIMDPRTGYPSQGMLSASVVSPRTLDSEAWTKPYYINGRQWAAAHKQKNTRVFLCEDRSELACAWLQ